MPISTYIKGLREKIGNDLMLGPAVAAVIRNDSGEVLIHQRSDNGRWEIPGGGVDPDEAPAQAVVREVYEETGLKVRPLRILCVSGGVTLVYPNGDRVQPYTTLFACEVVGGRLESRDGEALAFKYVSPKDIPEQFFAPPEVFGDGFTGTHFVWNEAWLEALD